ncbi:MAG: hypothetical protein NVS4B5_16270 [Vulcanimicrobiaceae bacterium]
MDSLIMCRCGHGVTAHFASGCHAGACACRRTQDDIVEAELHAEREAHRELYRRYAEPGHGDVA